MVLRGESSTREKSHSSDHKAFMWTSTISAPEMTVVLYDLDGSPLYHVRPFEIRSTSFTLVKGIFFFFCVLEKSFLSSDLTFCFCT